MSCFAEIKLVGNIDEMLVRGGDAPGMYPVSIVSNGVNNVIRNIQSEVDLILEIVQIVDDPLGRLEMSFSSAPPSANKTRSNILIE